MKYDLRFEVKIGGRERGIRTPGGVTLNGFQDRRFQPLSHLPLSTTKAYNAGLDLLEATLGLEPRNQSFAGSCLTTWLYRLFRVVPGAGLEPARK